MAEYEKPAGQFVAVLLHSATATHFLHLQSRNYAEHVALAEYYDAIVELADKYAEAFQGCYTIISGYPSDFALAKDAVQYLRKIKSFVDAIREDLPQDTALQNIVDEVVGQLDSTLYKLRFLR
jgi:HD superfamily phosphodiesterase